MSVARKWSWAAAAAALLTIVGVLLWDLDWAKPLVESRASAALERPVALGHIRMHWWARHPVVDVEDIRIAEPAGFSDREDFADMDHLAIAIDPWPLLHGALVLPAIAIGKLDLKLQSLPDGSNNWTLAKKSQESQSSSSPGPAIGRLGIGDGQIRFIDPQFKSDFRIDVATVAGEDRQQSLRAAANGTYAGQPVVAHMTGDSVLGLRDPRQPYRLQLDVVNGDTALLLRGSLQDPMKFAGADLALDFHGRDMADLYQLTSVPLPHTPPFELSGRLDYADRSFRFRDFKGRVGGSDLAGAIAVEPFHERRRIVATLHSRKVVLADLGGFIGAPAGKGKSPAESAEQQAEHQHKEDSPRVLPDEPINLPKINAADFDVRYEADRIESEKTPLDKLNVHLTIDNGRLGLHPLDFAVGGGHIVAHLALDGTLNPAVVEAKVDFSHVDLARVLGKSLGVAGTGNVGGAAVLDSRGNSVAQLLGRGNGSLKLFLGGGDLSALLVDLAGLDFGNSLLSAIGLPSKTQLRCFVGDFGLDKGVLGTRMLLIDTDAANIVGDGQLNFADETIDLRIRTQPKRLSVASLKTPIDVKGTFKSPHAAPEVLPLAARAGAAAVLGVFATPLAALIPTLQLGLGKDNNCNELVASAQAQASQVESGQGRNAAPPAPPQPKPNR